jgi:outer membrane protein assembly factor BamB
LEGKTIMNSYPTLRKWIAGGVSLAVLAGVVILGNLSGRAPVQKEGQGQPKVDKNYPWPLFGGTLDRNLVNLVDRDIQTEFSVKPNKMKNVKWMADLGSKSYGGPVVAEGKVFIGTNNHKPRDPNIVGDKGVLMCFNEADGEFLWQLAYDKLPGGRAVDWPDEGICSTPVIENGKCYFISNRCELLCVDTATGKNTHWSLDMMKELGVVPHNLSTCSPLIAGDMIFVCTSNGVDEGHINIPAPKAPSFLGVNKNTGKVVWKNNDPTKNVLELPAGQEKNQNFIKNLVNSGQLLMHGQWANPVYAEVNGTAQVVFPGGDGWLRSFDPASGKVLWKFDCNPKDSFYVLGAAATRNDFVNTPVVYKNKLYIGVGQDPEHQEGIGHFWCIDLAKATTLGAKNKDGDVSPKDKKFDPKAPENKNSALAWHYGGEGTPQEKIPGMPYIFGRTLSTACIHEDIVYIADLAGILYALDAGSGDRLWYHETLSPIWSSPYFVDGKILLGADDKALRIYEHGRKMADEPTEISMYGRVRATPVVANGTLYVMTENKLFAIR